MRREDSCGYDPMQNKAYDSSVHFEMLLDGKAPLIDNSANATTVLLI
jgi:hypothetical protein